MTAQVAPIAARPSPPVPQRPAPLKVIPEQIPEELKAIPQWVGWRNVYNMGRRAWAKVPIDPMSGSNAKSDDPATWASFDRAIAAYGNGHDLDGIGIVLTRELGLVGGDLDRCYEDGQLTETAQQFVARCTTYTELSPSGNGLRLIGRGAKPERFVNDKVRGVEVYDSRRYLTITGHWLRDTPETVEPVDLSWLTEGRPERHDRKLYEVLQAGEIIPEGQRQNAVVSLAGYYRVLRLEELLAIGRMYHDRGQFPGRDWAYVADGLTRGWQAYHSGDEIPLLAAPRNRISPAELVAMDLPDTPWLVPGYLIAGGVSVLSGEGGSGKTEIMLDTCLGICAGDTAMGQPVAQPGGILYLGPDMDMALYRKRFIERCKGRNIEPPGRDRFILDTSMTNLSDPATVDDIIATATGIGAVLIVYDALYGMHPGLEGNAEEDMGEVMNTIRRISVETGAASLPIQHWNKNTMTSLSNRGRGSAVVRDACDIYLPVLRKHKGTGEGFYLTVDKTRIRPAPATVEVVMVATNGGWIMTYGKADETELHQALVDDLAGTVVELLQNDPGKTYTREELSVMLDQIGRGVQKTTLAGVVKELKATEGVGIGKRGHADTFCWEGASGNIPQLNLPP